MRGRFEPAPGLRPRPAQVLIRRPIATAPPGARRPARDRAEGIGAGDAALARPAAKGLGGGGTKTAIESVAVANGSAVIAGGGCEAAGRAMAAAGRLDSSCSPAATVVAADSPGPAARLVSVVSAASSLSCLRAGEAAAGRMTARRSCRRVMAAAMRASASLRDDGAQDMLARMPLNQPSSTNTTTPSRWRRVPTLALGTREASSRCRLTGPPSQTTCPPAWQIVYLRAAKYQEC